MYDPMAPALLQRWGNFYVVVGSAAAALTGLQFIVFALFTQMRLRNSPAGIDVFSTPTVVYFTSVLLLAAVLCAPWSGLLVVGGVIALCGGTGTVYALIVTYRAIRQTEYRLVLEDWLWHILFPVAAHAMLLGAGLSLASCPTASLFTIAGAALLLLLIGIHNAWDTVTYVVIQRLQAKPEGDLDSSSGPGGSFGPAGASGPSASAESPSA
jgi:hypothetical protein